MLARALRQAGVTDAGANCQRRESQLTAEDEPRNVEIAGCDVSGRSVRLHRRHVAIDVTDLLRKRFNRRHPCVWRRTLGGASGLGSTKAFCGPGPTVRAERSTRGRCGAFSPLSVLVFLISDHSSVMTGKGRVLVP